MLMLCKGNEICSFKLQFIPLQDLTKMLYEALYVVSAVPYLICNRTLPGNDDGTRAQKCRTTQLHNDQFRHNDYGLYYCYFVIPTATTQSLVLTSQFIALKSHNFHQKT
jgi:hypothetical protein